MKQIARDLSCASSTVAKYILEFGLPLRDAYLPHQRRGQLSYVQKMRSGQIVPHQGEQEIIAKMVELRSQGKSYGDIVGWLNDNGVATKNKKARWDRPTVYKILKKRKQDQ